jgi:hypothetical protein
MARLPARSERMERTPGAALRGFHISYVDNSPERLLRSRAVAERFAVTTRTVNRWGDEGVIPVVRVSRGSPTCASDAVAGAAPHEETC